MDTLNLIMEDYSNLLLVPNMKEAKAKIGPAADGKTINEIVKENLN